MLYGIVVALAVAGKDIGLEVHAEKTRYMVMSRDQHGGQNHNMKIDNRSFERAKRFKHLGATLTKLTSLRN
jgi:hypothetical protein